MLLAALALSFAVDAAVLDKLAAGFSGEREAGAYAFGRLYDPELRADRELLQRTATAAAGPERAALLRGFADRDFAAPPEGLEARVLKSLDDPDPNVRIAAIECFERLPPERARKIAKDAFHDTRSTVEGARVMRALFAWASRNPDPALGEMVSDAAAWVFGNALSAAHPPIDLANTRALVALAANGVDVEPLLPAEAKKKKGAKPPKDDYWRDARVNAIRAAKDDSAALSALVETATTGEAPALRREAIDLIGLLPPAPRAKALLAVSRAPSDFDGLARSAFVRLIVREPSPPPAALAVALHDAFPELRFTAAAALADLAAREEPDEAALQTALAAESDPLTKAALRLAIAVPLFFRHAERDRRGALAHAHDEAVPVPARPARSPPALRPRGIRRRRRGVPVG